MVAKESRARFEFFGLGVMKCCVGGFELGAVSGKGNRHVRWALMTEHAIGAGDGAFVVMGRADADAVSACCTPLLACFGRRYSDHAGVALVHEEIHQRLVVVKAEIDGEAVIFGCEQELIGDAPEARDVMGVGPSPLAAQGFSDLQQLERVHAAGGSCRKIASLPHAHLLAGGGCGVAAQATL